MVDGKVGRLGATGDPQTGTHRTLARRQDRSITRTSKWSQLGAVNQKRNGDSHWRRMCGTASPVRRDYNCDRSSIGSNPITRKRQGRRLRRIESPRSDYGNESAERTILAERGISAPSTNQNSREILYKVELREHQPAGLQRHITLVSVTTEAKVPISTPRTRARSRCRFAGRSRTRSALAAMTPSAPRWPPRLRERPQQQHQPEHHQRMNQELDGDHARNLPGHRPNGRSATVTPSTNRAVGAAAFCRNDTVLSMATGRWRCSAAASAPAQADMISGLRTICRAATRACARSTDAPGR